MKAFRIIAPGKTEYGEAPKPSFTADDILIKVHRVGFCGSDLSTYRGANPLVTYPRIPGHEVAGEIAAVGERVPASLRVGQSVTVLPYTACGACAACRQGQANACERNATLGVQRDGAFTEFIAVPWPSVLAADLADRSLALVEPLAIGGHAVQRAQVKPGEHVLVIGCGTVGLGAIAVAAQVHGAQVIATDIDDAKLATARKAGAAHALRSDSRDFIGELRAIIPDGPQVVVEAVGSPLTYVLAVDAVAFAGRVAFIGYSAAPVTFDTKLFVKKELTLRGSRNATQADFSMVLDLIQQGKFPVRETVTEEVTWARAAEALDGWSAHPAGVGKIHVLIDP